ncbi:asparagine synthase (glutamine-hydrolyzing) [bacterium]|nr:asparagine synthase (glutamine-hydrolyzing) [bacterium]
MCGICGLVYQDAQRSPDRALLQRMTDVIHHRGPDDEGHFIDGPVGLGSRRLSIVGLGDGHMPMATEDESVWVAYNGEIYNHPELRRLLEPKGHRYRTGADTESLLHGYREWGEDFLEHVQGMFALALWDRNQRKLILARDRLGIKPLYIQQDGAALRFGSEIKSILCDADVPREIDLNGLNFYLGYLASSPPFTLLKGVEKMRPGEMLVWQDGKSQRRMFWTPENSFSLLQSSPDELKHELRDRLRETVRSHLMADVPVGAFLSGGVDSSVLVALMHDEIGPGFKTFSIGFEGHALFDETEHAEAVAKQFETDHTVLRLQPNDLLSALDDITWQLDEPLADSSCLPVYFVSKLAAEQVKVVMSGDGGDELLAGYRKYQGEYFRRYVSWLPATVQSMLSQAALSVLPESRAGKTMDLLRQVKKFFRGLDPDPFERHLGWAVHFEDQLRANVLLPEVRASLNFDAPRRFRRDLFDAIQQPDVLNKMLWVDLRHNLPDDMLTKVDRMSMLHSLEVRVPFLDHKFVEFACSLPGDVKLRDKTTKWILKEAFADRLPHSILHRRKHGFDVPVGEWFKHELRDVIEDACSEQTIKKRGLFDPAAIRALLNDHTAGRREFNNQLWILLSLERWQRQYLDVPPGTIDRRPV